MLLKKRKLKILDFDIENRPLSYWIDTQPTAEITAIASCWADDIGTMEVKILGEDSPWEIVNSFVARYNEADMVTGHYIRKHDLPTINGALMELGLPQLEPKLTCDTRLDMKKKTGIPASQEYLAELFELPMNKASMSQHNWRAANRLTEEGKTLTRWRVVSDVLQHILLRNEMLSRNLLNNPKIWKP